LYHSRPPKVLDTNWKGIKAGLLSTHYGEFSKLFCSKTDREVDIVNQIGVRSGEQLFNMIDMCSAFSCGKDRSCTVFCSLFDVDIGNLDMLGNALDNLQNAAKGTKESRNTVAHNLLDASAQDVDLLVCNARKLLGSVQMVASYVTEGGGGEGEGEEKPLRCDHAQRALAEIDGFVRRDFQVSTLDADERQKVVIYHDELLQLRKERDQLLEEKDQLLEERVQMVENCDRLQEKTKVLREERRRKFDAVARCLKSDIQNQLTKGKPFEPARFAVRIR
jgi:hypothetical protein